MQHFYVRQADETDIPRILPLFEEYRVFYGAKRSIKLAEDFLRERLSTKTGAILLACLRGNSHFAGFAQLFWSYSSVNLGGVAVLNDLFVAPGYRRQGIGELLLKSAHALAVESGMCKIVLETAKDNLDAQRLYLRYSFVDSRTICYEIVFERSTVSRAVTK